MSKLLCYSEKLLQVKPGHVITVFGKTKESAEYFEIFLGSDNGTSEDFGDIQLHIVFNFTGSREIVRNSYTKSIGWDLNEERTENLLPNSSTNPLKRGDDFKISIYTDQNIFFVSIDEKPFCTYEHRKPLVDIRRINVFGDVEQIYEVNHLASQTSKHFDDKGTKTFSAAIPTVKAETAVLVSGTPTGSQNGHMTIGLSEAFSGNSLFQVVLNFQDEQIIAVGGDENLG